MCAMPDADIGNHLCGKRTDPLAAVGGRHGAAVCSGRHGLAKTDAVIFPQSGHKEARAGRTCRLARGSIWPRRWRPKCWPRPVMTGWPSTPSTRPGTWPTSPTLFGPSRRGARCRWLAPGRTNRDALGRILDSGVMGLIVPHVSTAKQAEAIAEAVRFAPRGHRSGGNSRAANRRRLRLADQRQPAGLPANRGPRRRRETSPRSWRWTAWMSHSSVQTTSSSLWAIRVPTSIARRSTWTPWRGSWPARRPTGKPAGTPAPSASHARQLIAQGFTFVDISSDLRMLAQIASQELQAARA